MSRSETSVAEPQIFVARQPIFDRLHGILGYELLYRQSGAALEFDTAEQGSATALMVCEAALAIGLDKLCDSKRAFINADRQFLLDGAPSIVSPRSIVFEVGPDVAIDPEVVTACRRLKSQGFGLALDNFTCALDAGPLLEIADFIKVDFLADRGSGGMPLKAMQPHRAMPIAMRIETPEVFSRASAAGYQGFQGFFFGQPVVKEGRVIPPEQMNRLKLLQALHEPSMTVSQLEALVKPDPALCYRILRTVNSAGFGMRTPPASIREALLLLGRESIRRWAALWALSSATVQGQSELMSLCVIRARCCEVLAGSAGDSDRAATGFLIGICSLLDAILGRSMAAVLEDLRLPADVSAALLGESNPLRDLLDCVMAYTSGEWNRSEKLAAALGLDYKVLPVGYSEALRWARQLRQA